MGLLGERQESQPNFTIDSYLMLNTYNYKKQNLWNF